MNLVRTTLITSLATAVRIAGGLVLNKLYAVYVGPAGLAQIGQFGSIAALVSGISSGGVTSGVTRYLAEDPEGRKSGPVCATALIVVLAAALVSSLLLFAASGILAEKLLGDRELEWALRVFAAASLVAAIGALLTSVLNGRKDVLAMAWVGVAGTLAGVAIALPLTIYLGVAGALLAAAIGALVGGLLAIVATYFRHRSLLARLGWRPDMTSLRKLLPYSAMAIAAAVGPSVAVMLVRGYLAENFSWQQAGLWQGVWRISEVYLIFATSSLAIYFLPRLSETRDVGELRREVVRGVRTIVPAVIAAAAAIYICRDLVVAVLFDETFRPMRDLFAWQLIGDILKISSFPMAYVLIAKARVGPYVFLELGSSALFLLLSVTLAEDYGPVGVTYAHAVNCALYCVAVWTMVRHSLRQHSPSTIA